MLEPEVVVYMSDSDPTKYVRIRFRIRLLWYAANRKTDRDLKTKLETKLKRSCKSISKKSREICGL